jgi:hypothetical protein
VSKVNEREDVSVYIAREEEARDSFSDPRHAHKNIFAHIQNREREKIAPAAIPDQSAQNIQSFDRFE